MAISTNPNPMFYRNLYENTAPVRQRLQTSAEINDRNPYSGICMVTRIIHKIKWSGLSMARDLDVPLVKLSGKSVHYVLGNPGVD